MRITDWKVKDGAGAGTIPDAHDPSKHHAPTMLTTDLSLRLDPVYEKISRRFLENPQELADAFAKAWFKLTHRDMGPLSAAFRPAYPRGAAVVSGPCSPVTHELIGAQDIAALGAKVLSRRDFPSPNWPRLAWASAPTFRGTDKRGGANGAGIRREPQKDFAGPSTIRPELVKAHLQTLEGIPESVQ